jgi:hypothetical protein
LEVWLLTHGRHILILAFLDWAIQSML